MFAFVSTVVVRRSSFVVTAPSIDVNAHSCRRSSSSSSSSSSSNCDRPTYLHSASNHRRCLCYCVAYLWGTLTVSYCGMHSLVVPMISLWHRSIEASACVCCVKLELHRQVQRGPHSVGRCLLRRVTLCGPVSCITDGLLVVFWNGTGRLDTDAIGRQAH